jgi:hypothetical protein
MRMFTSCTPWRAVLAGLLLLGGCSAGGSESTPETAPSQVPVVTPPSPVPPPVTVTLAFVGTFGGSGTASGTFTYEQMAAPVGTNVRSLSPNATYPLTTWNFTVDGSGTIMPSSTFQNGMPGHSAEFCLGTCQFAGPPIIQISLKNDTGLLLLLIFDLLDPTPFLNPPVDLSEWGAMGQSVYRIPCPVCVPVAIFSGGVLNAVQQP